MRRCAALQIHQEYFPPVTTLVFREATVPRFSVVATFTVHLPYGFSSIKLQSVTSAGPQFGKPGYETDLLYLCCLATLVLGGPGPFAVDGRLARSRLDTADV